MGIKTISLLACKASLQEIEQDLIADPASVGLVERTSVRGVCSSLWYKVFEPFGLASNHQNIQTVLATTRVALAHFKQTLLTPTEEGVAADSTLLALSFDERWQWRFLYVSHLLGDSSAFPSYSQAQRMAGPKLIEQIALSPIPWDLLCSLLKERTLAPFQKEPLDRWIKDLNFCQTFLSPLLMFSLCEAVAVRVFGEAEDWMIGREAFFLVWRLYESGLSWLVSPDRDFVNNDWSCFGAKLAIRFPEDFNIEAYELDSSVERMAISSSAPLLLGTWTYTTVNTPSVIQYIHVDYCDSRGRYVTAERLVGPLSGCPWEGEGLKTSQDSTILDAVIATCSTLVQQPYTLRLDCDHLFLTRRLCICILHPLQLRHPYFSLLEIEKFIHAVCGEDPIRMRRVYERSGLWQTPIVRMYRSLVSLYLCKVTEEQIRRELRVFDLPLQLVPPVVKWSSKVRKAIYEVQQQMIEEGHREDLSERIVSAMMALQEELCRVSVIPDDLVDRMMCQLKGQKKIL